MNSSEQPTVQVHDLNATKCDLGYRQEKKWHEHKNRNTGSLSSGLPHTNSDVRYS